MNPFKLNGHSANGVNGHGSAVAVDEIPVRSAKRLTKGTEQQEALWAELSSPSKSGVVVEARAGCGKSTSCREAMWRRLERRPDTKIRYTCFNSANAKEFGADAPPGVDVGTMHSFGYRALTKSLGTKLEKNKSFLILDETRAGRQLPPYMRRGITYLVSHAKNHFLTPDTSGLETRLEKLALHYEIEAYGRMGVMVEFAVEVLKRSAEWTELCDFDDMLWLPALHKINLGETDVLFIDEAQDLNPTQQALIDLLCPMGRVVIVGDRYQAIYAFRGADSESISNLQAHLAQRKTGVATLPLTVTWRCPKRHVELAQRYVSDIQAHPSAIEGETWYTALDKAIDQFRPGDMVIGPANGPLIDAALKLITSRRRAIVRGRKVGADLLAILSRCSDGCRTIADLARSVSNWEGRELSRLADLDGVEDLIEQTQDRAAGLHAVVAACESPSEVPEVVRDLFSDDGKPGSDGVVFSTIHRAKGLEADSVFYLKCPMREPKADWEVQQQRNLHYVGLTRSKRSLTFVEMPKQ